MRWIDRLIDRHLVPDSDLDIRDRYYQALCLAAAALVIAVLLPVNLIQGMQVSVGVATALFGGVALALYLAARHGYFFPTGLWLALMATANVCWFPNGGSDGSVVFFFFPAAMFSAVAFSGLTRPVLTGLVFANVGALLWVGHRWPDLVTPFPTPTDRVVDFAGGFVGSGIAIVLMARVLLRVYQRDRIRLEETATALADSQTQLEGLFQHNPDAVVLIDETTQAVIDVNEGFSRLTGWSRDDIVGRTSRDIGLWVDPPGREVFYQRLSAEQAFRDYLARMRRRDGSEFWGSITARQVDIGKRRCLLTTTRDVSQQIDAQRAVAESRTLLATFINSTDDLLWMVDPMTFRLTTYNAAFAAYIRNVYGVSVREGLLPEDALPPELAHRWRTFYARALTEGAFSFEYESPTGTRTLLLSIHVVQYEGQPLGVSVFGKDITALKQAEAERDRIRLQFLEAQKMDSLGSLAGGVAHDFNNMLGGIMGYTDLLMAGEPDPARQEQLKAILQAATRSSELTRKLLAFARRGKNIVESVDLNAAVHESMAMLAPSLRPDVTTTSRLDAAHHVDADPAQLNQLIVNLCLNAAEAMPDGGTLAVGTRDVQLDANTCVPWDLAPGHYVELTVTDSGVGMTDEIRQRIFEPFFTTKRGGTGSGTGLGLPTVYGVVHLHRGAITVDSAPGQGATFTVLLPRGTLAVPAAAADMAVPGGSGLVLVVEDEAVLRQLATTALAHLGYRAVTACDGVEAIDLFRTHHRELTGVLLDLKMPRMAGRETFMEMRAIDARVPVLLCSGYGENEEAQGLISLGATGLLSKPYRIGELAEHLSRFGA